MPGLIPPIKRMLVVLLALWLSACAHTNAPSGGSGGDPFESYNRAMFGFNETVDKAVIKPVAQGYRKVVPDRVRKSVGNFFLNLYEPTTIVNDVLQGKFPQAAHDTMRFVINSTFGILGLFDLATPLGMESHEEDFGQTFQVWGVGAGPYLVLPLLGPSTVTDGVGLVPAWIYTDPRTAVGVDGHVAWGLIAANIVDTRARALGASKVVDVQLDAYVFRRETYLQRRQQLVYDGNPPLDALEDLEDFEGELD